jgi:hypothetical protein
MQKSFYERIKDEVIEASVAYESNYVLVDYLVVYGKDDKYSHVKIQAEKDNFLHLTGIMTNLKPNIFLEKCFTGTLIVSDINIPSTKIEEKSYKGTLRRKINVLKDFTNGIDSSYVIQENFVKNRVVCTIASTNLNLTIGFINTGNCLRPKSLISGDELDFTKKQNIFSILKKNRENLLYENIVFGDIEFLKEYSSHNPEFHALLNIGF